MSLLTQSIETTSFSILISVNEMIIRLKSYKDMAKKTYFMVKPKFSSFLATRFVY